jgi:hypothetical protein
VVESGVAAWTQALRQISACGRSRAYMRRAALDYARRKLAGWREVLEEDLFSLWREAAGLAAAAELIA